MVKDHTHNDHPWQYEGPALPDAPVPNSQSPRPLGCLQISMSAFSTVSPMMRGTALALREPDAVRIIMVSFPPAHCSQLQLGLQAQKGVLSWTKTCVFTQQWTLSRNQAHDSDWFIQNPLARTSALVLVQQWLSCGCCVLSVHCCPESFCDWQYAHSLLRAPFPMTVQQTCYSRILLKPNSM